MHSNLLLHELQLGVEKCALQFFFFLESEAVHSHIFGVDNTFNPLHTFELPWSKHSCSTQCSLQNFGVHLIKSTAKVLKCTSQVHSNKFIVHSQSSTPKKKIGTHNIYSTAKNVKILECETVYSNFPFGSGRLFTPFFFWSGRLFAPPFFLEWILAQCNMLACM
jgi:hypothetical protein